MGGDTKILFVGVTCAVLASAYTIIELASDITGRQRLKRKELYNATTPTRSR